MHVPKKGIWGQRKKLKHIVFRNLQSLGCMGEIGWGLRAKDETERPAMGVGIAEDLTSAKDRDLVWNFWVL